MINNNPVQVSDIRQIKLQNAFFPLKRGDVNGEFVTNKQGYVQIRNSGGIVTNSLLRKDEWEQLDTVIVQTQAERLNGIARLEEMRLVHPINNFGVLVSQYNKGSQVTRATVNLTGQSVADLDLQDLLLAGVPVPVVHKEFTIGERFLEASRTSGESIDTTNAAEASRVVAEELERMFFVGDTTIVMNGVTIYGITNEPNINTGVATGDFGTIGNIQTTFQAMIAALAGDNYHGDFEAWVATSQYTEMTTLFHTDGSGETPFERQLRVPQLRAIHAGDFMTDGTLALVQMTTNVIDLALFELGMIAEWTSGDGMTHNFKIMSVAAPRVKSDYAGQSGIAYYTGA